MEALLSDPNREIICVTLMKFNNKAKSFHVAVRGNFPAARDFAEPDTYTTTRRRAVGNESSSKSSSEISSRIITSIVKRSTHYLPVTQTSSQRPSPIERSGERAVATEPRTILRAMRRTNRHSNTRKPSGRPRACVERTAAILAVPRHTPDLRPEARYA